MEKIANGKKVNEDLIAALVFQSMEMTGNLSEEDKAQAEPEGSKNARLNFCIFGSCKPKWRPSGRIRVWDDNFGDNTVNRRVFSHWEEYDCWEDDWQYGGPQFGEMGDPHREAPNYRREPRPCRRTVYKYVREKVKGNYRGVEGVHVRARRWFITHNGYTDRNGDYSCDGRFKNPANYSIPWERYHFEIRTQGFSVLDIWKARYNGPKKTGDWDVDIRAGTQKLYAHIHRAAFHYYYQNIKGLRRPPLNDVSHTQMKIAALAKKNKGAFAGMCLMWRTHLQGVLAQIKVRERKRKDIQV